MEPEDDEGEVDPGDGRLWVGCVGCVGCVWACASRSATPAMTTPAAIATNLTTSADALRMRQA